MVNKKIKRASWEHNIEHITKSESNVPYLLTAGVVLIIWTMIVGTLVVDAMIVIAS